jgi:C4-dicarboxylate-specific signal transduction histidine kinase
MGEMAASIAHELNQPLAAIVANGDAGKNQRRSPIIGS